MYSGSFGEQPRGNEVDLNARGRCGWIQLGGRPPNFLNPWWKRTILVSFDHLKQSETRIEANVTVIWEEGILETVLVFWELSERNL